VGLCFFIALVIEASEKGGIDLWSKQSESNQNESRRPMGTSSMSVDLSSSGQPLPISGSGFARMHAEERSCRTSMDGWMDEWMNGLVDCLVVFRVWRLRARAAAVRAWPPGHPSRRSRVGCLDRGRRHCCFVVAAVVVAAAVVDAGVPPTRRRGPSRSFRHPPLARRGGKSSDSGGPERTFVATKILA